ncbi:MAG TPA: lysozyme, partial [Niabella sp.]|nr:lysozyme [Niabella sp.]
TQGQFDALVSFAYNLGIGALQRSTLLKLVRVNPKNPAIADEFAKWVNAGGKRLNGLVKRRAAEAALYFSSSL